LRGRQLAGLKWRRQVPVDVYFADFLCKEARLVVELDGEAHLGRDAYDRARTRAIQACGYQVIRFTNDEGRGGSGRRAPAHPCRGASRTGARASPSHSAAPSGPLPLPGRGEEFGGDDMSEAKLIRAARARGRSFWAWRSTPRSRRTPSCSAGGGGLRGGAERAGVDGGRGLSGHAAGAEPVLRGAGGQDGAGAERGDPPDQPLRPQELLLSRPAAGLSDQPAVPPHRGRGGAGGGAGRRVQLHRADRAAAPGAGRGQVDPRHGSALHLCRSEPLGHGLDGDRLQAGHALGGGRGGLCADARTLLRALGTCDGDMEKGNLART
jgi:hypothetical protein